MVQAHAIIAAFDAARGSLGGQLPRPGDRLLELPIYLNARRLLERAAALEAKAE